MAGVEADTTAWWRALVLVVAVVAGLVALAILTWFIVYDARHRPWIFNSQYSLAQLDLLSRINEVNNARTGESIYYPFNAPGFAPYPPAAIFLFLPITLGPIRASLAAWTGLSIACMAATYLVVLRVTRRGSWLAQLAIAIWACVATVVLFSPMDDTLAWGQTSTIVLLLVTLDVLAVRDRSQGFLVGLATAFKLFPGVVILFWIVRRQWRAAATATLTFVVLTAGAWAVWPRSSAWIYFKVLFSSAQRTIIESPGYNDRNASVTGFFLRMPFLSHSAAQVLGTVVSLAVAIAGVWLAARLDQRGYRVTSLVILLCTSVLIAPVAWDHYFTFAPLLIFVVMEVGLSSTAGKLATLAFACCAFPWVPYLWGFAHPNFGDVVRNLVSFNALFVGSVLVMVSGAFAVRRGIEAEAPEKIPQAVLAD